MCVVCVCVCVCVSVSVDVDFECVCVFRRMINQGGSKIQVLKQISKGVMRHPIPFLKFNKNAKQIREDISKGNN